MKSNYITISLLCLIFSLGCKQAPATLLVKYGDNTTAGRYLETRGIKLYYEIYGQGQPLLLIHGNGGSVASMEHQIPHFAKQYQVIAMDSRAQGKSTDLGDSLSYEMMGDDLNALLDSLRVDSCMVFGWSDGGINGLLLAMRHPEKVRKLAVTGANLVPDSSAVDPFIWKWAKGMNDTLAMQPVTPETKAQKKLLHLLSYEPHITTAQLGAIQCPTLVIAGDHDVIRNQHTVQMAEAIPNSYLWIIPNSGHATPIHKKEALNQELTQFFASPFRKIEGLGRLD